MHGLLRGYAALCFLFMSESRKNYQQALSFLISYEIILGRCLVILSLVHTGGFVNDVTRPPFCTT